MDFFACKLLTKLNSKTAFEYHITKRKMPHIGCNLLLGHLKVILQCMAKHIALQVGNTDIS